jgi:hypothetical protein
LANQWWDNTAACLSDLQVINHSALPALLERLCSANLDSWICRLSNPEVIKNISLEIKSGEKIGICGRSGRFVTYYHTLCTDKLPNTLSLVSIVANLLWSSSSLTCLRSLKARLSSTT